MEEIKRMTGNGLKIGIDLGTCFSSIAIMKGFLPVTNYVSDTTGLGIPSLYMFSEGRDVFGEGCQTAEAYRHPENVVREIKTTIRADPANLDRTVTSGGKDFTYREVLQKYLRYLIDQAKEGALLSGEFDNSDLDTVTITAPVGISTDAMMASEYSKFLKDSVMSITGLDADHVHVLQEPVAAALSYLRSNDGRRCREAQRLLVFDLGGGTLDVTVIDHDPTARTDTIKAKAGDLNLGGNNFDKALGAYILKKLDSAPADDEERLRFERAVTDLKIRLTASDEASAAFVLDGQDLAARITRKEFEDSAQELLDRAMTVLQSAVAEGTTDGKAVDKVVLVGGSSFMPMIRRQVTAALKVADTDVVLYDPARAVARGAALFSLPPDFVNGSQNATLRDTVTHTYGIDSLKHELGRNMIFNLIYKGTSFDDDRLVRARSTEYFTPVYDDQTEVVFEVFENQAARGTGAMADWVDFGHGEVSKGLKVKVPVPPEYLGKACSFRMTAELAVDSDGVLIITIFDETGHQLAYSTTAAPTPVRGCSP